MKRSLNAITFSLAIASAAALYSTNALATVTLTVTENLGVLTATGTCSTAGTMLKLSGRRVTGAGGATGWLPLKSDPAPACGASQTLNKNCSDPGWGPGKYKFKLQQGTFVAIAGPVICP